MREGKGRRKKKNEKRKDKKKKMGWLAFRIIHDQSINNLIFFFSETPNYTFLTGQLFKTFPIAQSNCKLAPRSVSMIGYYGYVCNSTSTVEINQINSGHLLNSVLVQARAQIF